MGRLLVVPSLLASAMGVRRWFLHTPPRVGLALTGLVGVLMRDMALTRDEVVSLMDCLLTSGEPPTGTTRLSEMAGRERGRPWETVRVRAAAQLPGVVATMTKRVRTGAAQAWAAVGATHPVLS